MTIKSTSVSSNPATTWTPDEYGSFNFSGNKCDNIKAKDRDNYKRYYEYFQEMDKQKSGE